MEAAKNAVIDKEGSREGKGEGEEGKGEIWEVDSEWKDMVLGRREVDAKVRQREEMQETKREETREEDSTGGKKRR